jgi:dTDP-glucose pyrophosphorylase
MARKGVILAAGKGKRLLPITEEVPKVLIEVGGLPWLSRLLLRFSECGCRQLLIVVGHLGEMIIKRYGEETFGMRISYVFQERPEGTAKALQLAEEFVGDEPFMLSWGDVLTAPENYKALWERFEVGDCHMCMLVNWLNDVSSGADVTIDGDRVIGIVEKPPVKKAGWNQSGLFVIGSSIFKYLKEVKPSARGEYEFTDAVKMMIEAGEIVVALPAKGYVCELGTHEQLRLIQSMIHEI